MKLLFLALAALVLVGRSHAQTCDCIDTISIMGNSIFGATLVNELDDLNNARAIQLSKAFALIRRQQRIQEKLDELDMPIIAPTDQCECTEAMSNASTALLQAQLHDQMAAISTKLDTVTDKLESLSGKIDDKQAEIEAMPTLSTADQCDCTEALSTISNFVLRETLHDAIDSIDTLIEIAEGKIGELSNRKLQIEETLEELELESL